MNVTDFLGRLDGVRRNGNGWMARCPAHQDKSPSLSITEGDRGLLLHCFALCETRDIVATLGLRMADLFFDAPTPHGHRPTAKPVLIDRVALAFRFELAALDHRLRAEQIFSSASKVTPDQLNDDTLDHALDLIEQGHKDIAQAELFEGVADDVRMKEFLERDHEHKRRVA